MTTYQWEGPCRQKEDWEVSDGEDYWVMVSFHDDFGGGNASRLLELLAKDRRLGVPIRRYDGNLTSVYVDFENDSAEIHLTATDSDILESFNMTLPDLCVCLAHAVDHPRP